MSKFSLCGSSVANTGEIACDPSKGVLRKIMLFNGSMGPSEYVDQETFLNTLIGYSKLSKDDPNKVFVINEAQDLADASEANKEGTLNLGFKAILQEGKPGYTVKIFGGSDMLRRLRTFNNQTVRVIEYDANGVFWGTMSGDRFKGFQARIFFDGGKIATGQNVEEGIITFTLSIISNSEYKDNFKWMETSGNVESIVALMDVNMVFLSKASNAYTFGLKVPGSNLMGAYDAFPQIGEAVKTETFTAGYGVNYATPLPITSVTTSQSGLVITFDATAFGNVPAQGKIKVFPPSPADLDGADVTEVELVPVIVTK